MTLNEHELNSREEISKLLIRWGMPTRQVFISELIQLVESAYSRGIKVGREEECNRIRNQIEKMVKENPDAYMVELTEARFMRDLRSLLPSKDTQQ